MEEQNKQFVFIKENLELMQEKMNLTQENVELIQEKAELIQAKMNLQAQLAQKQAMYDQQVAENNKLLRENHELRFPSQIKDTKVRTRGPEFTKKLNNGRGEGYGMQRGKRRNRFQGK
jgi:hypothetical protein